jgi:hypothetical protein
LRNDHPLTAPAYSEHRSPMSIRASARRIR